MLALRFTAGVFALCFSTVASRSFVINNDSFVKDGVPFDFRSGSLHYFRVPKLYWRDRIQRMKALGLNGVTMYVAWNYHEEVEGQVIGIEDVTDFLDVARSEGMLVLFRPGPYICGEWEFGGLPAWLLWHDKAGIKLRTYETQYISAVTKWLRILYEAVSSRLYSRGGPIVMIQIENEYGSFGNCADNADDAKYMNHLLDLAKAYFQDDVVYSTIDGGEGETAADLGAGSPWKMDPRVLATVDGALSTSSDYARAFERQAAFNAPGHSPKMWSELWVGWFTVWRDAKAANKSALEFRNGVQAMVQENASFSLYMAHGGTNFGFWSGANGDQSGNYTPDITSYDYSSPISESGDHNIGSDGGDLFEAVRSAIALKYQGPAFNEPLAIKKVAYGHIQLPEAAGMFENLHLLTSCDQSVPDGERLPSFEDLKHAYGLVLYHSDVSFASNDMTFVATATHDRVQVFVDGKEVGVAYRPQCPINISLPAGHSISLLVENMGRINYGEGMYDFKGYLAQPPVVGKWSAQCLPLSSTQVQGLPFEHGKQVGNGPVFRRGALRIDGHPADTFLDMRGFSKGYVWVNGHNLGRFWETAGPQHTLYLPAPFLLSGVNEIIVLDLHDASATWVDSVASPRYADMGEHTHFARYSDMGERTVLYS